MTSHEYQKIITKLRLHHLYDEDGYKEAIKPYLEVFQLTHGDRVESGEIPPLQTVFTEIQRTVFRLYYNEETRRKLRQVFDVYEEMEVAVIPNNLLGGKPLDEWYTYVHYIPQHPKQMKVHRWLTEEGYSSRGYTVDIMFLSHIFGFNSIRVQRNRTASIQGDKLPYPEFSYLLTSRLPVGGVIKRYDAIKDSFKN